MERDRTAVPWLPRAAASALAILTAAGLAAAPPLGASPAVFPSSQITAGLVGVGRTVTLGTRIVEFQVQVLGVLKNAGPAGDLILFRASGPALRSVGGLAAGMSGSPIYFGGRLAGAFSYSFQATDPFVGLFTPIEDMLKDLPPGPSARHPGPRTYAIAPVRLGGRTFRRIVLTDGPARPTPGPDALVAVPAATPLFVSGFGGTELESLGRLLEPRGILPMQGSGPADLPGSLPLEPGSAVGVGLMQGDISAYAIGTLTYRDGDRILAFGHPFADVGPARYLLTNATIFQTVRGLARNLNIGAAGAVVGTISEDRPAAIGGTIGRYPRVFGVRVRVTDTDAGLSRRFSFQVVTSKELAPALIMLGAQEAIERALNRSGEGTALVRMALRGRELQDSIIRENLFYSDTDVAQQALTEVPQAMRLMFDNDFADVGPSDMEMDVRVTRHQQTAAITDVEALKTPVSPGDVLAVRVKLRPFRGAPRTEQVTVTVPADFPPGPAMLVVRAGGVSMLPPSLAGLLTAGQALGAPRTLTEAITAFEKGEKNTDVIVELVGSAPRVAPSGAPGGPPRISAAQTTPWVLRGRFQIPLVIGGGR
jgi:SpoIVB peptidase S55